MEPDFGLYKTPDAMEPLIPDDDSKTLENLAVELIEKASKLSGTLNPITRSAIGDFLRPMNSYYSNLIEGHDTHPIDIEKALNKEFSEDKEKRDLQIEARAHIEVHKLMTDEMEKFPSGKSPYTAGYLKEIHKRFYDYLPEDMKKAKSEDGELSEVIPGEFRKLEVKVGRHIGPDSTKIESFMNRFEEVYSPTADSNKQKIKRIIAIAASHHRLAWIHPFLDGNGRVVRLFSDANFIYENLDASGLWSISRGLARSNSDYKAHLANADLKRYNDYDGRGNLSNKMLVRFCEYFLQTAIDQVDYMYNVIDVSGMLDRIGKFADLMVLRNKIRPQAKYILMDAFLKGKLTKSEAIRLTGSSDKTLKLIIDPLYEMGLLKYAKEGKEVVYYVKYPISYSPILFPGLYPKDKELDMM
ncbi:MAG: Fic family protein [Bacteroidetes bacterium]|nr:Fic family protein [Bacteroidota bacterium]